MPCSGNSAKGRSQSRARPRCAIRASITPSRFVLPIPTTLRQLRSRFNQEYVRRYGHANATADIEIVVLHSLATLHTIKPELSQLARGKSSGASALLETRPVFFLEEDRFLPTQVYDRYALGADFSGHGPALVVEYGSSTLIGPGDTFRIGALGEIHIDCHH